jgi:hypothetical protein
MSFSQFTLKDVLGFTVLAALITTAGTLIGLVLKEWLFARSFEEWKSRRSLDQVYRRYRDPIVLAALELCNRLTHICDSYPPDYLESELLGMAPKRATSMSAADPYFRHYRLVSSVYRLCSLLGWIALYRQDIVFLEARETKASKWLDKAIYAIRGDLADGQLNAARDWEDWQDALLFREEQRAVGESMIVTVGESRVVMGYSQFSEVFLNAKETSQSQWIKVASMFLLDPQEKKDFRLTRIKRLIVHLVDLIQLLGPGRLRAKHLAARTKYQGVLSQENGE